MRRIILSLFLITMLKCLACGCAGENDTCSGDIGKGMFTKKDLIGKYEVPWLTGGIIEFKKNGTSIITMKAPSGASKESSVVIKEKYCVEDDVIYFEMISINGKKGSAEKSQQEIISVSEEEIVLRELPSGSDKSYKRIE